MPTRNRPVIYVTQPILPEGRALLDSFAEVHENALGRPNTEAEMIEIVRTLKPDALLGTFFEPHRTFSRDVIAAAPDNLKLLAWNGLGFDHIDLEAATERGIYVTYVDVHCATVSDQGFALLMASARKIVQAAAAVREGRWEKEGTFFNMQYTGTNIHHQTIGVVGLGRVGAGVARRAAGFDMQILYSDPVRREQLEQEIGARHVTFETLLSESNFVICCAPLSSATYHLFNRTAFRKMKRTATFINITRGALVDTPALCEALTEGWIEAAALDVIDPEPLPSNHPILAMPNAIIVPHIAGITRETRTESHIVVARDAQRVLAGFRPKLLLNPNVLKIRPLPEQQETGQA
jgi:glyoxylate reductase